MYMHMCVYICWLIFKEIMHGGEVQVKLFEALAGTHARTHTHTHTPTPTNTYTHTRTNTYTHNHKHKHPPTHTHTLRA
jgi:hypothetical protein